MYQLVYDARAGAVTVVKSGETVFIRVAADNPACLKFVSDWKSGANVLDQNGSPASYSDAAVRALGLEPQ